MVTDPEGQPATPEPAKPTSPPTAQQAKSVTPPSPGETITNLATGNSYTMGAPFGEGSFGVVYDCVDGWNNQLAAKILKPVKSYEEVKASFEAELTKLVQLRHPFITYIFDAFEYRDTFYLITERCDSSLAWFFEQEWFKGHLWLMAIARCLLQAVHFIHSAEFVYQDIHVGNVLMAHARDEMIPDNPGATQFKLGDLGVAKLFTELDAANTRAQWMRPPEVIDSAEFGPLNHRMDIFHCGLLFLQLAYSRELRFTAEEMRAGKPRQMALELQAPLNFALEKALRRHVSMRTGSALELWRDLNSPGAAVELAPQQIEEPTLPFDAQAPPEPLEPAALSVEASTEPAPNTEALEGKRSD
jgi:serine/threonine protein kinase